eukprot:gene10604-biopygen18314
MDGGGRWDPGTPDPGSRANAHSFLMCICPKLEPDLQIFYNRDKSSDRYKTPEHIGRRMEIVMDNLLYVSHACGTRVWGCCFLAGISPPTQGVNKRVPAILERVASDGAKSISQPQLMGRRRAGGWRRGGAWLAKMRFHLPNSTFEKVA